MIPSIPISAMIAAPSSSSASDERATRAGAQPPGRRPNRRRPSSPRNGRTTRRGDRRRRGRRRRRLELGEPAIAPATSPTRTRSRASSGSAQRRHGSVGVVAGEREQLGRSTPALVAAQRVDDDDGDRGQRTGDERPGRRASWRWPARCAPAARCRRARVCWLCSTAIRASRRERVGVGPGGRAPAPRGRARSPPRWRRGRRGPRPRRRRARLRRSAGRRRACRAMPAASTNVAVAARLSPALPHRHARGEQPVDRDDRIVCGPAPAPRGRRRARRGGPHPARRRA